MSVFLMSGIAALAYIGIFDFTNFLAMPNSAKAIAFVVIFLALFFFVFFLVNLKRRSSKKKKTAAAVSSAATATAATATAAAAAAAAGEPADVTRHKNGLLAAASSYQRYDLSGPDGIDETSGIDVIYEENGVPYINSDLAKRNNQGVLNKKFVKLVESVTGSS
jgi:hypothetical protein